ncbi:putative 60S ribosomal protein L34-A [Blattamonas nauphoetae]|uniref:60S ribosomal protein L34-A n=1 Tax=Blattamonas nauphoetae TaxID=2049346 RepID=A0ABQ9XXN2_9EUKA|nr:putative 60S ribosomal protein L34-A [Blattamonas nauphoetae]KAK2964188.1 putative 60S ribosomal protein L34-A [Blattamonas nauphoetae]
MVQRIARLRRNPYNTASNRVKIVKTPGGRLTFQYLEKRSKGAHCGDCHAPLHGITRYVRTESSRVSQTSKHVTRAYGGSRCAKCVKNRIIRAFLIEEQKIVKQIRKSKAPELRRRERAIEKQKAATLLREQKAAKEKAEKLAQRQPRRADKQTRAPRKQKK